MCYCYRESSVPGQGSTNGFLSNKPHFYHNFMLTHCVKLTKPRQDVSTVSSLNRGFSRS